jgi:hypothetical protein
LLSTGKEATPDTFCKTTHFPHVSRSSSALGKTVQRQFVKKVQTCLRIGLDLYLGVQMLHKKIAVAHSPGHQSQHRAQFREWREGRGGREGCGGGDLHWDERLVQQAHCRLHSVARQRTGQSAGLVCVVWAQNHSKSSICAHYYYMLSLLPTTGEPDRKRLARLPVAAHI